MGAAEAQSLGASSADSDLDVLLLHILILRVGFSLAPRLFFHFCFSARVVGVDSEPFSQ